MNRTRLIFAALSIAFFSSANAENKDIGRFINSEGGSLDLVNQVMKYTGNAKYEDGTYTITGDSIEAKQAAASLDNNLKIIGAPATVKRQNPNDNFQLNFSAKQINFNTGSKALLGQTQISFEFIDVNGQQMNIQGDFIKLTNVPNGDILITGTPLSFTLLQKETTPLNATANQFMFQQKSQSFELNGNVELKTNRESISAETVRYDIKNKIMDIPKVPNRRVKMIQKVKSE